MRIVAGTARGRTLLAPDGAATRPTGDRVREAIFNALYSLDDAVAGATVLDLFAGSGALGLEAWSRGARHVTFVDSHPRALRTIAANVAALGVGADACTVVRADAHSFVAGAAPGAGYDVALLDPPYDFAAWGALLAALPASLAVIESNREVTADVEQAGGWELIRRRRYGGTVVTMVRRLPPA